MSRQRVYLGSEYADILRILGDSKGFPNLGITLERVIEDYLLQTNNTELKELLDDKKRENRK